jgi:6-phosphogluconolactonase
MSHSVHQLATYPSAYGTCHVGSQETLFAYATQMWHQGLSRQVQAAGAYPYTVGCSGGSTPQRWYHWMYQAQLAKAADAPSWPWEQCLVSVSDERCVPSHDPQSNWGNLERLLLDPLGVPASSRMPLFHPRPTGPDHPRAVDWESGQVAQAALQHFHTQWTQRCGPGKAFDLCFLGMGDDGHTASLFPGSALLQETTAAAQVPLPTAQKACFAATLVPGKGWRLTLTPWGLGQCGHIVVLVMGESKAARLAQVLHTPADPARYPIQCLNPLRAKVTWLIDTAAASAVAWKDLPL